MLEILCEETHEDIAKNIHTVVTYVDITKLHEIIFYCYMLRKIVDHELAVDTAIKTHNLLKHLADFEGIETS